MKITFLESFEDSLKKTPEGYKLLLWDDGYVWMCEYKDGGYRDCVFDTIEDAKEAYDNWWEFKHPMYESKSMKKEIIEEDKVISFDNPQFGQCVILVGGPRSGKTTVRANLINLNAKVLDADGIKELVDLGIWKDRDKKEPEREKDRVANNIKFFGKEYDISDIELPRTFKNSKYVSFLHDKTTPVKNSQYKQTYKLMADSPDDKLPNVIFDITGDPYSKLSGIIDKVSEYGYNITVVWCLTNIEVALKNNEKAERKVDWRIVLNKHEGVLKSMEELLADKERLREIDQVYVVLSEMDGLQNLNLKDKSDFLQWLKAPNVFPVKSTLDLVKLPKRIADSIKNAKDSIDKVKKNYNPN